MSSMHLQFRNPSTAAHPTLNTENNTLENWQLTSRLCSYYSSQGDLPNPIEGQLDAVFDSLKGSSRFLDPFDV